MYFLTLTNVLFSLGVYTFQILKTLKKFSFLLHEEGVTNI